MHEGEPNQHLIELGCLDKIRRCTDNDYDHGFQTMSQSSSTMSHGLTDNQEGSDVDLFVNKNHFSPLENNLPTLYVNSYGHRFGPLLPTPHITFDLRSLPNPPRAVRTGNTGLSKTLCESFFANVAVQERFDEICQRICSSMSEGEAVGQQELSVGVFCELGKHRSVSVVEELARTKFEGWNVVVDHRDVHPKRSSNKSGRSRVELVESDG